MDKAKAIVFFSGGVDSYIHLVWAIRKWGSPVKALFIDFGHTYVEPERERARALSSAAGVELIERALPIGDQQNLKDSHLQCRNVFMLLLGSYYSDNLVFGMLENELSEDKNPRFVKQMQQLLRDQYVGNLYHSARPVTIHTPFGNKTKTEMIRWYLQTGFDPRLVTATIGCYNTKLGGVKQCGKCLSCFNRWVALTNNKLSESYLFPPALWMKEQLMLIASGKDTQASQRTSLRMLWKKRKYLFEIREALAAIYPDPVHEMYNIWKAAREAKL